MKNSLLILILLLLKTGTYAQKGDQARKGRLYSDITNHERIESECIGLFCFTKSDFWKKADSLFKDLSLHAVLRYFDSSSRTIKYYAFLRMLDLNDNYAYRALKRTISDSTKMWWAFDDTMGQDNFNQLLANEYKMFIDMKYRTAGTVILPGRYYFGKTTYHFSENNKKQWRNKLNEFTRLMKENGIRSQ